SIQRSRENLLSDLSDCASSTRSQQVFTSHDNFSVNIRMPGVVPCFSSTVDFVPHAKMETVHHMLLFGCRTPVSTSSYCVQGTCEDEASIMYAWARNAPPTKLPRVIKKCDQNSEPPNSLNCGSSQRQPFIAGIYLLMSVDTVILPGKRVTNADVACDYTSYPIYPFAFRTHTHRLGKVVSGYRIRDGKWTQIGRQSPQLPQAFYPTNKDVNVKYGDTIAARCMFTGEGRATKTYIGGTSDDEMCNFYIMYYMDNKHVIPYMNCMETAKDPKLCLCPKDHEEDKSLLATEKAEQVLDQGDLYSLMSKLLGKSKDVVHFHKYNPSETAHNDLVAQIDNLIQKKDLGSPSARLAFQTREHPVLVRDRVHKFHQLEATAKSLRSKLLAEGQDYHFEQVSAWPQSSLQLGQVSGLALDSDSNLVIFHRGDHHWGADSFDSQARYQQRFLGPIQQSTVLVVDPAKGNVLKASGRNMFYLPHGITTDRENNYWITDVALHQVSCRCPNVIGDKILLALGEAFTPGSDSSHFCQPTDVAVDTETGNIFVSDGYCNARILKFSADGKYLSEWGAGRRRTPFRIPHSLVFLPDKQEVCVADRENGRIQCFIAETGEFVKEIKKEEFGGKVFAITYNGLIFAVNGVSLDYSAPLRGFVINYSTKDILDTFTSEKKEFKMPHDIVETRDGSIFIGDAGSKSVFKFTTEKEKNKNAAKVNRGQAALPAIITILLLIPLLLVISIGVFICWRKNSMYDNKLIIHAKSCNSSDVCVFFLLWLGKAVGSLNLGNFFASHNGYSRQGFDQLSTEGSDHERNDEDSSDSENEEYSALPPPQSSS
uniref:Copper type II ascorbate-dependent monooxygenase C-terminal domain-containing protein n=1 Tax=Mola mola TaxID=94237 RepID=A0A3Q4BBV5_MOLML